MIIKIFFLYLSFQTKQLRNQFHSAPEKGLRIRSGAEVNYVGFELNRQKTEKPTSLNICCSRTSQLVTNNPPDRVVMLKLADVHSLKLLCFVFDCGRGFSIEPFNNFFTPLQLVHNYNT